jgi:hypothetical protein
VDQSEQHDRTLSHDCGTVVAVPGLLVGHDISDDELAALALAADPDQPIDDDAVPLDLIEPPGLLPEWYMPAPMSTRRGTARRWLLGWLVLSLVAINSAGLCVTYGFPEIAW